MRLRTLIPLAATAGALALPAAAQADTLLAPAPGAVHLAAGGGYMAWAAPNEDTGWRLVVRAPDGTVTNADVRGFASPPNVSIGTVREDPPAFRLLAVYSRDDGDVYAYDLRTGREERVARISSRSYRESAVSLANGTYVFNRSGGRSNGLYAATRGGIRRIDRRTTNETATNGSRVAYRRGSTVFVRRLSGAGRIFVLRNERGTPRSIVMTRYRVSWLGERGRVFQTPRFGGSGRREVQPARQAARRYPDATAIGLERDRVRLVLDAQGVRRLSPPLFGSAG